MSDHRNDPIPATPSNWLEHTEIEYREGCYPTVRKVLRHLPDNQVTPYVVHTAYAVNGEWQYERGSYCLSLTGAMEAWAAR